MDKDRVLSIQSHVVSGYVGNRAATFPLQTLGYDVDAINTVQFSNHTGYGHTNGHKTSPEELSAVFEGLVTNGLLNHPRVLTGYIPGASALRVVQSHIADMQAENPKLIYVLDPVMGDGGKLYVAEDVIPVYRSMLSLATIITPNHFEVELLSGSKITDMASLQDSLKQLHTTYGLPYIALSSIPLPASKVRALALPSPPSSYIDMLPESPPLWYEAVASAHSEDDVLVSFASTYLHGRLETWAFALPTIHGYFSGVGDFFSAMVLAHFDDAGSEPQAFVSAVSKALLAVQQILLRTHLYSLANANPSGMATPRPMHGSNLTSVIPSDAELDALIPADVKEPKRKARRMRIRELRVVQERALIAIESEGWPGAKVNLSESM
ncbi:bud site selection-related protein [Naematelia encephala]|uniref:pyridoxal kinase n=1 Tax=Naematelia encephala TaxID=71784 RepID=A0A1Y2BDJ5_9TREE|nr:bud site selection-related protein [Naematelia encephala]